MISLEKYVVAMTYQILIHYRKRKRICLKAPSIRCVLKVLGLSFLYIHSLFILNGFEGNVMQHKQGNRMSENSGEDSLPNKL